MQIIINGMFRSGTTHLWKLISADKAFSHSYCEPLHPNLIDEISAWKHYQNYSPEFVEQYWDPQFSNEKIMLGPGDHFPELAAYLKALLPSGSIAKFVRLNLRIGWILELFQEAFVINIIRDPRAVCFSTLHHPDSAEIVKDDIPWEDWHAREYYDLYSKLDDFKAYLAGVENQPPYIKILALWQINIEQSSKWIDRFPKKGINIRYEDLCSSPEDTLLRIYQKFGKASLPEEVGRSIYKDSGSDRIWQKSTTASRASLFRQIDPQIWRDGIKAAGLELLMKQLAYEC